uniref:VOC domain-containing protein n=1 Tax=Cuerna arida TaxID=1464854 RepID=A0A1B6G713_9HEMI
MHCDLSTHFYQQDFILQQFMFYIRDPKLTLHFYTKVLGMRLFQKIDVPSRKYTAFFLGYAKKSEIPADDKDRTEWMLSRKVTLEMVHKWGSENNSDLKESDNSHGSRRFGHIGLMVPDMEATYARLNKLGVPYERMPRDGKGILSGNCLLKI